MLLHCTPSNSVASTVIRYTHIDTNLSPCWVGLVVSVSASNTVGRGFASRPGHTKDHKNGTKCLPVWHAMR